MKVIILLLLRLYLKIIFKNFFSFLNHGEICILFCGRQGAAKEIERGISLLFVF